MRREKTEENEQVRGCKYYLDYINCGECYLLTEWENEKHVTVTLRQSTVLEDLHEKHGGSIRYHKLCRTTFHLYESDNRSSNSSGNLDKVINLTKIDRNDWYYYTPLLKHLLTGERIKEISVTRCIVRWAKEESSRGEDWYILLRG